MRAFGLMLALVLLAAGSDLLPSWGAGAEAPVRLSGMLLEATVTATVKGEEFSLRPAGAVLAHPRLPAWNWVGLRRVTLKRPKKAVWPFVEADKPGKAVESCLWVHPVNDGRLRLDFPGIVGGGELSGFFHALPSAIPRMKVEVEVLFDGKRLKQLSPRINPGGIWEFHVGLPGSGLGLLSFVIKQQARGKNHLCFDGVIGGP